MTMKDITESDIQNNIPLATKDPSNRTIVKFGDVAIGSDRFVVIAGPCAVENRDQVIDIAHNVKKSGAQVLRGGAFKPLTFPYQNERSFELGEEGLKYLAEAREATGMPVVTEVMDPRTVEMVSS